jgi:cytochrome c biogenesis protein CcdA
MSGLLATVLGIALVDSLNPSAILVTLGLLGRPGYASRVATYVAAVFLTYLGLGVVLMLGLDALSGWFESPVAYAVQGCAGAALLIYSFVAPGDAKADRSPYQPRSWSLGAMFALGITVTVVEFSTALPYVGAIGLLTSAGLAPASWVPILVAYNLVFVVPPLLLLAAFWRFGERVRPVLERIQARLSISRTTWLWILGVVGFFLLADSLANFDFFGLVDIPDG